MLEYKKEWVNRRTKKEQNANKSKLFFCRNQNFKKSKTKVKMTIKKPNTAPKEDYSVCNLTSIQYSGHSNFRGRYILVWRGKSVQSAQIDARLLIEEFLTQAVVGKLIRPSLFQPAALQCPRAQLPDT